MLTVMCSYKPIFEQMYSSALKSKYKSKQVQIQLPVTIQPTQIMEEQQPQNIVRKDYRNGTYIGNVLNNTRNGFGLLALDSGDLLFGNWQNGQVYGQTLFLSSEIRIFGKVGHRGVLQGFHVCKIINSHKGLDSTSEGSAAGMSMTLYGNFKENKLFGRFVAIIKQNIYLCNASNSDNLEIIDKFRNNKKQSLLDILSSTFPYIQTFQLHGYISSLVKRYSNLALSKYNPIIQPYTISKHSSLTDPQDNKIFYGYSTHRSYNRDKCREFGFMLCNEELVSVGEHRYGQPHGLARVFEYQGGIHDGIFSNGKAQGIGIRYRVQNKRFIFGKFRNQIAQTSSIGRYQTNKIDGVDIQEEGTNWPHKIVKQYRKDFHLRSIYFDSQFGEIFIDIPYEEFRKIYQQLMAQESTKNPVETSPLNNYFTISPVQNRRRYTQTSPNPNERTWNKKTSPSPSSFEKFKQKSFTKHNNQPISTVNATSKGQDELLQYRTSNNYSLADKNNVSPFTFDESKDYRSIRPKQEMGLGKQEGNLLKNRQNRANTVYSMIGQFKK